MSKDFDTWNYNKKQIDEKNFFGYVHEREIWWCQLGVNIGHEEDGKNDQFERPVLVIRKWSSETIIVLPLTTKIKRNKYHYVFKHDEIEFAVILSQIRLISTKRLTRRVRKMDHKTFDSICNTLQALIFNERTPA